MASHRTVLIAGPTASGKSTFAAALARAHNGVIVNADSMQVYKELRILTARPAAHEEAAIPHRLFGIVSAAESYSVARWINDVKSAIEDTHAAGRLPIVVGGTGLYFNALTQGLSPIPGIPDSIRVYWRAKGERTSTEQLHHRLGELDPTTARTLSPTDKQRVVRALEVFESTGRPLAEWQKEVAQPVLAPHAWIGCVIDRSRDDIYRRCEARVDAMMKEGAIGEVQHLRKMQLSPDLPAMRALGVPPLMSHLEGHQALEEAISEIKRDTRRYVKRQLTWLRRYMITWNWISAQQIESNIKDCFSFING